MAAAIDIASADQLTAILARQRAAFLRDGAPSAAQRRADLLRLKQALLGRRAEFEQAINADFGHRAARETAIMEFVPTIHSISHLRANVRRWMRPEKRSVGLHLKPGRARVQYQPRGVVGVMSPWNYPMALCMTPLATALAAGNRVMIKPSEYAWRTAQLVKSTLSEIFDEEQVAVVPGDAQVAASFAALPFDHLLFTGSTEVGKAVMRAASANLVPVTLELGGKSPVIIDDDYPLARAARSIAYGKLANAGQTCIAPDYVLLPDASIDAFIAAYQDAVHSYYPGGAADAAFSSIINERNRARLQALLDDARAKHARVIEIGVKTAKHVNAMNASLVVNATHDMRVMNEEIFGPILPLVAYRDLDAAIAYVNARPRPLALYVFSHSSRNTDHVLARTTSGNVSVNDTLLHYAIDDLPFGGIGPSGMGAYHGDAGFRAMSHAKGVFLQSRWNLAESARPPFGKTLDLLLKYLLR